MRQSKDKTKLWLSSDDTSRWASRHGAWWPCSFLSGRRLWAMFDGFNGDLVDMSIDGGRGDQDCPLDEFNAIVSDFRKGKVV